MDRDTNHDAVDEALEDVLDDGDGGQLELAEVADEGHGDDADGELGHRGDDGRGGDLPHLLRFVPCFGLEGVLGWGMDIGIIGNSIIILGSF